MRSEKEILNKKEDMSDRKLTIFLILVVFISLVSVWTMILSLDFDVLKGQPTTQTTIIKQGPNPSPVTGQVSLTILPNPENERLFQNATNK